MSPLASIKLFVILFLPMPLVHSKSALYTNLDNMSTIHQESVNEGLCLIGIINEFRRQENIVVSLWTENSTSALAEEFIKRAFERMWTVDLHGEYSREIETKRSDRFRPHFYVIVAEDVSSLSIIVDQFVIITNRNYKGHLIIYVKVRPKLPVLLSTLCNNQCIKNFFIVITPSKKHYRQLDIYFPKYHYFRGELCHQRPQLELMLTWSNGHLKKRRHLGNHRKPYFNDCYVEVLAVKFPPYVSNEKEGICMKIIAEIGRDLGIAFNITLHDPNEADGDLLSFLYEIEDKTRLIVGDVTFQSEDAEWNYSTSVPYFYEKLLWVVPSAKMVPKWVVLYTAFPVEVWMLLLSYLFASALLIFLFTRSPRTAEKLGLALLWSVGVFVSESVPHRPVGFPTRAVFISLVFLSLIITSFYESNLLSVLTNPIRERQISSLREILDSDLKVGIPRKYEKLISNIFTRDRFVKYGENYTEYNWLLETTRYRNVCTVVSGLFAEFSMIHDPVLKLEKTRPYFIRKELALRPFSIATPKDFFVARPIDHAISNLMEGGILEQWMQEYVAEMNVEKYFEETNKENECLSVLDVNHIQGAFVFLGIGSTISIICLLLEVALTKLKEK